MCSASTTPSWLTSRLKKLDLLKKIDEHLIKMEDDMSTIKQKVVELEGGLNSVNSEVADLKESIEKKAEKEHLQLLEEEVEDLHNRSRKNNLVFYNIPEKAQGQNCAEFIQNFIASHMALETLWASRNRTCTQHPNVRRKTQHEETKTHPCGFFKIHR